VLLELTSDYDIVNGIEDSLV